MDFSRALTALKAGCVVARDGWNGKGMFLYLVPAASYPAQTGAAKAFWGDGSMVPYGGYIAMKTALDNVVPWLASQTDLLADDWAICQTLDVGMVEQLADAELIGGSVEADAVYRFAAFLTTREGVLVTSSAHEAGPMVELVGEFLNWPKPPLGAATGGE